MKTFLQKYNFSLLLFLLGIVVVAGCTNTQKIISSGNYDVAIDKSIKKLSRNKTKEKHILYLKQAFDKAQQADMEKITFLKKEGRPNNAVQIYSLYDRIKRRQEKVKPLLPLVIDGRRVAFEMKDVDADIIAYKQEAAGYLYTHAQQLMNTGDKHDARKAYEELMALKTFYPSYKDVDHQLKVAYNKGLNYVFLDVDNDSRTVLPKEFINELLNVNSYEIEGKWYKVIANNGRNKDDQYDYTVVINLKYIDIGPEAVKEVHYEEKKEIEDGFTYVYDDKGNVKKDSLGNDIKVPKYKEITAHVTEVRQTKIGEFRGSVDLYDERANRKIFSEPFGTRAVFENFAATAQGNLKALKPETKKMLGNKPVPFPTDFQMMMDGSQQIKHSIRSIIRNKRALLES